MSTDIDFARKLSIAELRRNGKYRFNDLAVRAYTRHNDGLLKYEILKFTNKCFFIAVCEGLLLFGFRIDPFNLAAEYNMLNNELIDTDNPDHQQIIKDIAKTFRVRIEFFVGEMKKDGWFTTPDGLGTTFGEGNRIIRLLNRGGHFEYLTKIEGGFITDQTPEHSVHQIIQEQAYEHKKLSQEKEEEENRRAAFDLLEREEQEAKLQQSYFYLADIIMSFD